MDKNEFKGESTRKNSSNIDIHRLPLAELLCKIIIKRSKEEISLESADSIIINKRKIIKLLQQIVEAKKIQKKVSKKSERT